MSIFTHGSKSKDKTNASCWWHSIKTLAGIFLPVIAFLCICTNALSQDLPNPAPNNKTLATGSFVIAMDNNNQSNGANYFNLKAYGLVVHLLNNQVKVKWIIKAGKAKDGIDFSVNASRIKPTTAAGLVLDFRSGPFVIQSADVAGVSALVDAYNNTLAVADRVKVYQTNAAVLVDERYDLTGFKPKAALLNNGGNWDIHRDFFLDAGITGGMNTANTAATNWSKAMAADLLSSCYTFASEAHWEQSKEVEAKAATDAVKAFLVAGGNALAECAAVRTYENAGRFHSTGGINSATENKFNGALSTLVYPNADLSYTQFQGAINIDNGGSLKNWTYSGSLKNNQHDHVRGPVANPNIGAAVSKLSTAGKGGLIFYLGNHKFDNQKDITVINGERMYLNAFLTPSRNNTCTSGGGGSLKLGNQVWNDYDGDGKRDLNEPGIAGATITLYTDNDNNNLPDGEGIATTTTDQFGKYAFTNLAQGRYIASMPILPGYTQTPNNTTGGIVGALKPGCCSLDPDANIDNDNNLVRLVGPNGPGGVVYTNGITLSEGGEPTTDGDDANSNLTLDLAQCGNGAIGDFVWNDLNGNGIQDAGEPGINGVVVRITYSDGTFAEEATHSYNGQDGYYDFVNLGPGTYVISFTNPPGFIPGLANQGSNDAIDSDPVNGSVTVTLTHNQSDFTIDAAFIQNGIQANLTTGNQVWNDYDGDGRRDLNEPGIPGATVRLYRDNNNDNLPDGAPIATTTTDANGKYLFTNLSQGRYIASMPILQGYQQSPNTATGGVIGSPQSGCCSLDPDQNIDDDNNLVRLVGPNGVGGELYTNAIILNPGQEPTNDGDDANGNLTLDLAQCGVFFIGDFVWNDLNGNGIQDAGEGGLNGITVRITFSDGTIGETTTATSNGQDGYYNFRNLGPGTYVISFPAIPGFTPSPANQGSDREKDSNPVNGSTTVVISNASDFSVDAGYVRTVNACTFTVNLVSQVMPTTTNYDGSVTVSFLDMVPPYSYTIQKGQNSGGYVTIRTVTNQTANPLTISGLNDGFYWVSFIDSRGCTGMVDPDLQIQCTTIGGTLTAGKINCINGLTTLTANVTGGSGTYQYSLDDITFQNSSIFTVPAGTYSVYVRDFNKGCIKLLQPITVLPGNTNCNEICLVSPTIPNIVNAKLRWVTNADGTITIRSTFAKTFVDNTYGTNAIGWGTKGHTFSNLVGSDHVQLALFDNSNTKKLEFKLDYITASNTAPSGYKTLGVLGGEGQMILGNASDVVSVRTSIDSNLNGFGYVLTTNSPVTDLNYTPNPSYPNWIFEVWYEVTVKASAFGTSGFKNPMIASVHASPSKTGNNTEVVVPGDCPTTGSIGDFVWSDLNGNGIQDANEPGLSGVTVTLTAANGTIRTTTSGSNGQYLFSNLPAGTYTVTFSTPAGFAATLSNQGSDDAKDSDPINGSVTVTLAADQSNLTIDFGLKVISDCPPGQIGGIQLSNLTKQLFVFTDGSVDANWQSASKGYVGDVAIDGLKASERTSGTVPYSGTISTNDNTLSSWQKIVNDNPGQAFSSLNQSTKINSFRTELENAFAQINAFPASAGYSSVSASSLNGLNTQDGVAQTFVINVTSGFGVSSKINITGDANDIFILRWDEDANFSNGYNGQVKFQSGGAIVPMGGLKASNFIHVAGDINSSGGGSTPNSPYPQGPRKNNGTGDLINGGSDFNGGGFFTGYWLTTGAPTITGSGQPYGETSSLSNGIFVGGWYSKTTKFSMTSGTSGVYVAPAPCVPTSKGKIGDFVFNDVNGNGIQDAGEPGLPSVTVTLTLPNGSTQTTTSGNNGQYAFSNLPAGTYTVSFSTPAGFVATLANQGFNDAIDSDLNADGEVEVTLALPSATSPNTSSLNVDAGYYNPGLRQQSSPAFTFCDLKVALELTHPLCSGHVTGKIMSKVTGNTNALTYSWSNGSTGANLLAVGAGTYTLTVQENATGCSVTSKPVELKNPAKMLVTLSSPQQQGYNVTCKNSATGNIELKVKGGVGDYSYSWNTGATTAYLTNVPAGKYTVVVKDEAQCPVQKSINLTEPANSVSIESIVRSIDCNNANGSIAVKVTGGLAPYRYMLNGVAATFNMQKLSAGVYSITVIDALGCEKTKTVEVKDNRLQVMVTADRHTLVASSGITSTTLNAEAIGGTGKYTYTWNANESLQANGNAKATVHPATTTDYTVTVQDEVGCKATASLTVKVMAEVIAAKVPAAPVVVIESMKVSPNPTNGIFNVLLNGFANGKVEIRVLDANGKEVATKQLNVVGEMQSVPFNLMKMSRGMYFIHVVTATGSFQEKVLIK